MAILFVTHSVFEAVFLSQRVLVMGAHPGQILTELVIAEPYPRSAQYRSSIGYVESCRTLSQALESAHSGATQ